MKRNVLIIFFAFISALALQAQTPLPESIKTSAKSYIYTISKDNLRKVYLKEESVSEKMLGTLVAEYKQGQNIPPLKRGNYIIVKAVEHQLNFTDYTVDDLHYSIVPDERMMLCLYDSLGHIINDAVVKCGSKSLKFDQSTQTYNISKVKNEQVVEVNNRGVYHYLEIEKESSYYYAHKSNSFEQTWRKTKALWNGLRQRAYYLFHPDDRPTKYKYTGFIVFSKPRYKPGETVKLKAYMAKHNGTPYNKPIDLRLYNYYPYRIDTVLVAGLAPYRPGMYEYQFELTDSLELKLDTHYTITLETGKERDNTVDGQFKYEDYELKSIRLAVSANKKEYIKGDSARITLKVSDENEMAVYGGRAEMYLTPLQASKQQENNVAFVPDTLWKHDIDMSDISEKTITLPDSVFPPNISLHYQATCIYLSADNERVVRDETLYRNASDYAIDFSLSLGMLTVQQLHRNESQRVTAKIQLLGKEDEIVLSETVELPHTMPVPWFATDVEVATQQAKGLYYFDEAEEKEQINCRFYRQTDSIYLKVENPANIPFWYKVYKDKKQIASGHTTSLDHVVPAGKHNAYSMQLSYLFADGNKHIERSLPYVEKNISLDVSTPTSIYPGQKTNIELSVTDKKGKPVHNADITAYAFTTKFGSSSMPPIAVRGKMHYAKRLENSRYIPDEQATINQKGAMTWDTWKQTMTLDTIEYYKFLYPDTLYMYSEPTSNGSTQLIPYVVIDGALQGISMLWIDERLYYTDIAQHLNVYTFQIEPGRHNLLIRTYDREIKIHNLFIKKGEKTIVSFNAEKPYIKTNTDNDLPFVMVSKLLKKKERGILSEKNMDYLASQLITIDNNFGRLELPNSYQTFNLPAYIRSGNTFYYLNHANRTQYNYNLGGAVNSTILTGPFPTRNFMNGMSNMASVYADNRFIVHIPIEGGNRYTLFNNYQKIKSWGKPPFDKRLSKHSLKADFKQEPLTPQEVNRQFEQLLQNHLTTLNGSIRTISWENKPECIARLNLRLGKDRKGIDLKPALVFIMPEKREDIGYYQLHYGGTRSFRNLPPGDVTINLVFNDSTSYSQRISLRPYGENYLLLDSIEYELNNKVTQDAFRLLHRSIRKQNTNNPYIIQKATQDSIVHIQADYSYYNGENARKGTITGTVLDSEKTPIIGASVIVEGTTNGTVTNLDGKFELTAKSGDKIIISFIGFESKTITYAEGRNYTITLKESAMAMDEVIVVGYGVQKRQMLTGSVSSVEEELAGSVAGVMIRGSGSTQDAPPLIIVNGIPFNGKLEDLDQAIITNMSILKDASATSIYGSRAANGVIMIQTSTSPSATGSDDPEADSGTMALGNSMRRNFHDDAFWQPRLTTNEQGKASFEVTYPDDITRWDAYFIAIGNKKQTDKKQLSIHSFKALTARLSMPAFAVRGDSLNAVGRIANHLGDSVGIKQKIEINSHIREMEKQVATSSVEQIPVIAETGDSLTVAFSLQMTNGYFDGEERSISIAEQGMLQTYGDFQIINDNDTHRLQVDTLLGTTTLHAEASSFELFLREIEKLDKYPYLCNEQMASKIKALLSKKHIMQLFGKEFKEDGKINELIGHLNKNKNSEGLWGWWNKDQTEHWISKQVVSAMLDAEKAGYKTGFDKYELSQVFECDLRETLYQVHFADRRRLPYARQQLLDHLVLLKRMDASVDYQGYFKEIDTRLPGNSLADKLKTMEAKATIGMLHEIKKDSLMRYSQKTIMGSLYWSDEKEDLSGLFYLPYKNNIENTLTAYRILKKIGESEEELIKISNYFFECRRQGSWQNTYESSRIIETIMPDMLKSDEQFSEVSMFVNGKKVSQFPYSDQIETGSAIEIRKEGALPLFVTAYQQAWNKQPEVESGKGFTVRTRFAANGGEVSYLNAGKPIQMEVVIEVTGEANYVQIEVPIPAGCSYESKHRHSPWKEVHREHFKEKVVIFSNKLNKGKHEFTIELLPRYTGTYHLNPAKAELMYFPTFYGNEEMKKVKIK